MKRKRKDVDMKKCLLILMAMALMVACGNKKGTAQEEENVTEEAFEAQEDSMAMGERGDVPPPPRGENPPPRPRGDNPPPPRHHGDNPPPPPDDNMRGFDPASEDDMPDNGMSRYMENDDEEGWD